VKEHSPLFGLVKVGDEIVNVDGVDTTGMSTVVVAHLLGRKKGRCSKMRISVSRGMVGTIGIRTISMPKRYRRKSSGHIHLSPTEEHSKLSPIHDQDSSFMELHTSTPENVPDDRDDNPFPFHFIGAGTHDDEEV
jgi:orotate phosphoribosyltransferase